MNTEYHVLMRDPLAGILIMALLKIHKRSCLTSYHYHYLKALEVDK